MNQEKLSPVEDFEEDPGDTHWAKVYLMIISGDARGADAAIHYQVQDKERKKRILNQLTSSGYIVFENNMHHITSRGLEVLDTYNKFNNESPYIKQISQPPVEWEIW